MKDRYMIVSALIFLLLIIGTGVNKSLVECNRMIGKSMAPGAEEIYRQQIPYVVAETNAVNRYMQNLSRRAAGNYPVLASIVLKARTWTENAIKHQVSRCRDVLSKVLLELRCKLSFPK